MSESPKKEYGVDEVIKGRRRYTEKPVGPLTLLVMASARTLHDSERPGGDWFGLDGITAMSFCRRSMESFGIDWTWISDGIARENAEPEIMRI